jgi:hypothetical protein
MFAYKSSRSYFCRTPARHANHHQLWDATEKGGELLAPFVPRRWLGAAYLIDLVKTACRRWLICW